MFAHLNLPGSSHFEEFGPDTKQACEAWIKTRRNKLIEEGELPTSSLPARTISNKEASKWKFRDGTKVFNYYRGGE